MKISLPFSKSISNRALMLAALSDTPVVLHNLLESDDTRYLRDVLEGFGKANLDVFKVIGIEAGKSHTLRIQYYKTSQAS